MTDEQRLEEAKRDRDRILAEIQDAREAIDFYTAMDEALRSFVLNNADLRDFKNIYNDLLKLHYFFFLQIYLAEK